MAGLAAELHPMFFVASKLLGFVVTPSNAIALLGIAGLLLLMMRCRRSGLAALATAIAALALFGWTPASYWLLLPLSERFPAWQGTEAPAGIIVLGGGIDPEISKLRDVIEVNAAGDRLIAMLQLAKRFPDAKIVYSGGSASLIGDKVAEAPLAGRLFDNLDLAHGRVVLESESRTTEENATSTRNLVGPKPGERWLLVTSAWHMPRAVGLYRKAGFDVMAYPVDFRSRGWSDATKPLRQVSLGLERADLAVHEWVGLVAAKLSGKSDELFPGPR